MTKLSCKAPAIDTCYQMRPYSLDLTNWFCGRCTKTLDGSSRTDGRKKIVKLSNTRNFTVLIFLKYLWRQVELTLLRLNVVQKFSSLLKKKKNVAIIPMNFTAGCSEAILSFSFYVICALSVITIT